MAERSDARRNRALLLDAGRAVFTEHGLGATLDDVARVAGVGVATAYRHFGDKHELAAEVLAEATQQIADDARAALEQSDPWDGFVDFLEKTAERQSSNRALGQALNGLGRATDKARIWPEIYEATDMLVRRAKRSGSLRRDFKTADIVHILAMLAALDQSRESTSPPLWPRYLAIILDGLHTPTSPNAPRQRLPGQPDQFTSFDTVIRATKGTRH